MNYDPLKDELINLARALRPHGIYLIVGGGYGLYLRTEHILKTRPTTRFDEMPEARATEDLDFLLSLEIITDAEKMKIIRDTIDSSGYKPVANYFQFKKEISGGLFVKIDLLAARPTSDADLEKVKIGTPRIRPHGAERIHAYITDEAITLTEGLFSISLSEREPDLNVFLPHPFTYLLLKLFAIRDHLEKVDDKSKAREHATDIYRTIGMMTENEWEESVRYSKQYADYQIVTEAAGIVSKLFPDIDSPGPIEIYRLLGKTNETEANIEKVINDLTELFQL